MSTPYISGVSICQVHYPKAVETSSSELEDLQLLRKNSDARDLILNVEGRD